MEHSFFDKFQNAKVLVVGDVMIDCYLSGTVTRISPEAPVPVMDVKMREYRPGGAANVALNLNSLGAHPILCSVIGDDEKGEIFTRMIQEFQLESHALFIERNRKTTIKYRIIGNKTQMLRVDDEDCRDINPESQEKFLELIDSILLQEKPQAIIFVDYDKGVLSPALIEKIITNARKQHIICTVDPKKKNFHHYHNVSLFKPNLKELTEGLSLGSSLPDQEALQKAMKEFALQKEIEFLMTTLSEKGIIIYDRKNDLFFEQPAYTRNISDVSGAGDTVISIATLCLIQQLPPKKLVHLSNLGGGLVCEHIGVVPITANMLENEFFKRTESHNN